jgi:hypothetical protein
MAVLGGHWSKAEEAGETKNGNRGESRSQNRGRVEKANGRAMESERVGEDRTVSARLSTCRLADWPNASASAPSSLPGTPLAFAVGTETAGEQVGLLRPPMGWSRAPS